MNFKKFKEIPVSNMVMSKKNNFDIGLQTCVGWMHSSFLALRDI
jgi:hypothetical protein